MHPAEVAYMEADRSPPGLVNRRKVFGDLGALTFWFGYQVRPDGRYADLVVRAPSA